MPGGQEDKTKKEDMSSKNWPYCLFFYYALALQRSRPGHRNMGLALAQESLNSWIYTFTLGKYFLPRLKEKEKKNSFEVHDNLNDITLLSKISSFLFFRCLLFVSQVIQRVC